MSPVAKARRRYFWARAHVRPYQRIGASFAGAAIAPAVPTRLDPVLTRTVSRLHLAIAPRRKHRLVERMERNLGSDSTADLPQAAAAYWLQRVETRWGQARGISITGWNPEVELTGLEHLEAAQREGRGAILWRVSCHCAIPLNQALARAGFPPVHLSSTNHLLLNTGTFFTKRVGTKVAPILRRGEDAPLLERVAFDDKSATSATRRLVAVLRGNGVVTIVGDLTAGRKRVPVMINNDQIPLANGGAKISLSTGAALLPVTVTRIAPLRYRVDVLPPLVAPAGTTRDAAVTSLVEQFAEIVADVIRRDPSQWPRWRGPSS